MMYSDIKEESFVGFSLRNVDTGIEDGALDLITGEIIFVNDFIVGEEINLCFVEFLP